MLRYHHTSPMPHPIRVQFASIRDPISIQKYSLIVDNIHAAHNSVLHPSLPFQRYCACSRSPVPLACIPSNTNDGFTRLLNTLQVLEEQGSHAHAFAHSSSTEARLAEMASQIQRLKTTVASLLTPARQSYYYYHARIGAAARNCQHARIGENVPISSSNHLPLRRSPPPSPSIA